MKVNEMFSNAGKIFFEQIKNFGIENFRSIALVIAFVIIFAIIGLYIGFKIRSSKFSDF